MKLIGKIDSIFILTSRGVTIITDKEVPITKTCFLPTGTEIELRRPESERKTVQINSVELAYRAGKDFLAFILKDSICQTEVEGFQEVWCDDHLEPIVSVSTS